AVDDGSSSTESSRRVPTKAASVELDALIRRAASGGREVVTIHHSRGGAVGVETIAALDDGRRPPIHGYRGAILLDPAIDAGVMGALQSVGGAPLPFFDRIPDDGGFEAMRCTKTTCRDIRHDLGRAAGVEVLAIRNPDAGITNFHSIPVGMRVLDLHDRKPHAFWYVLVPWLLPSRISEAHGSVLVSETVGDCVVAEVATPGACTSLADP
ncbi:MAG: hypothetical protein KDB69_02655, partial [Acidimicrobiia bacterium]|nr:hypothetical protein [Acidimicrobiia bacterium]